MFEHAFADTIVSGIPEFNLVVLNVPTAMNNFGNPFAWGELRNQLVGVCENEFGTVSQTYLDCVYEVDSIIDADYYNSGFDNFPSEEFARLALGEVCKGLEANVAEFCGTGGN